jgi:hypothetical protein
MALRNTILALCPEGEVWSILEGVNNATCIAPADIAKLKTFLASLLEQPGGAGDINQEQQKIAQFNRVNLTAQLADVLLKASA